MRGKGISLAGAIRNSEVSKSSIRKGSCVFRRFSTGKEEPKTAVPEKKQLIRKCETIM
jgi:hypothetical protein